MHDFMRVLDFTQKVSLIVVNISKISENNSKIAYYLLTLFYTDITMYQSYLKLLMK